tara:strand:+ start:37176 stop:38132 length:957 start_codon:yes stop_codon:yes gene_type:complete
MKKIKKTLQKRKVKIFLIFLFFSSLAWFISKLSDDYTGRAVFDLEFKNVPDSLLFTGASKNKVEVKLKASGFTFLGFSLGNKKVRIDISKAKEINHQYVVPKNVYQLQIEKQLPQSMELLSIDEGDDIILDLYALFTKKIPVISKLRVELEQNFMLDKGIKIKPDSIIIKGPKEEIDKISNLQTEKKEINNISNDFSEKLTLIIPDKLNNVKFSNLDVKVYGVVSRFSEKVIKVPVEVINLPEDFEIKIFPDIVGVLCKAKIDDLKELKPSDFRVIADYNLITKKEQPTIPLEIKVYPKSLNGANVMDNEVTYILKRK